jgi:F0F1-type ATP synthase assembly protein I
MPKEEVMDNSKYTLKQAYRYTFGLTIFFFVTAFVGAFVGNIVDERFNIKPAGTLATLVIFYGLSWIIGRFILLRFIKKKSK